VVTLGIYTKGEVNNNRFINQTRTVLISISSLIALFVESVDKFRVQPWPAKKSTEYSSSARMTRGKTKEIRREWDKTENNFQEKLQIRLL
jgi:hypothetical protein